MNLDRLQGQQLLSAGVEKAAQTPNIPSEDIQSITAQDEPPVTWQINSGTVLKSCRLNRMPLKICGNVTVESRITPVSQAKYKATDKTYPPPDHKHHLMHQKPEETHRGPLFKSWMEL